MDPLQEIDREYQESTAYHEAAHTIVCIAQEIPILEFGLRIDSKGNGESHTYRRTGGNLNNTESDARERGKSVILLFAGYLGQVKMFPEIESEAIANDEFQIDELLDEIYPHESEEWQAAKNKLREKSERLVADNWPAIETLAKALLAKPWTPQGARASGVSWSDDTVEKLIDAKEVEEIVRPFRLIPIIRADRAETRVRPAKQ
jgi:hypothetical protein